ncbi:MAG: 2-oxo acid dehydrogenase subunit E2 [Gammaproteobacteria bacterium]|nr:2-oxo acid dehydrogenase subunit E2 [Gammaproteobacteria bacterium]
MAAPISSLTMPKWGIEMTEGTITSWRVTPGTRVEKGQEILDVETEKIVNAVEAPASGVLRRIIAGEGETRAVGELIGIISDEGVGDADIERFAAGFVAAVVSFEPAGTPADETPGAPAPAAAEGEEARVSPIARRLAERLGIDISLVKGTGRNGRVSKEDVEGYAAQRNPGAAATASTAAVTAPAAAAAPASASAFRRVSMSSRRRTIARRLQESKQTIPHYRLAVEVEFGALLELRAAHPAGPSRPSVNDYLLRAAALALIEHPQVNAQLDGDDVLQFEHADIAVAVAAEAGLVTPILRAADTKSVAEIAAESRALVERARQGTLQREEITGGSFTISNLGMFGISRFDAIINAPQVAILAVGAVGKRVMVRDDRVAIGEFATLTLSADHRVVDGAVGAAFLRSLGDRVRDPRGL